MLSDARVKTFVGKLKPVRYKDIVNRKKLLVVNLDRNYKDILSKISNVKRLYKTASYNPETNLLSFKSHYDGRIYRNHSLEKPSRGSWIPSEKFTPNPLVG